MRNAKGWVQLPLMARLVASMPATEQPTALSSGLAPMEPNMPRTLTLAAALLLALSTTTLASEPSAAAPDAAFHQQFAAMMRQASDGDFAGACKAMDALRGHASLATVPTRPRVDMLLVGAAVYWRCERFDDALAEAQAANAILQTSHGVYVEAMLGEAAGKTDVAVDAMLAFARTWPRDGNYDAYDLAWRLQRELSKDPARQTRFLQDLFDAGFDPVDADPSAMWFELARLQLDAGDVPRGKAAAARVMGWQMAARMRIDRRFDPVLADDAELGDAHAQSGRLTRAMEAKLEASPTSMAPRLAVAEELVLQGDYPKAIAYIDDALHAVRRGEEAEWVGLDLRLNLMRARSTANLRQGKPQQALEDLEMAALFLPPNAPDLSGLMRADLLCDLGRGTDAARAMTGDTQGLPWLERVTLKIDVCIATLAGNTARARKQIEALKGMLDADEQETLVAVYLRVGDVEAAAPVFIALLDNPATRSDALKWAQNDMRTPGMPGMVDYRKAFDDMMARADVKVALDKYGRVLTWDMYLRLE